ncbi:hypothetical protein JKP88DRAFT_274243 [Tribonema minus]|uniref:Uncharacterized protein n=1 Tax=Tribonema minus TaxID=303371 RepID=A0A836C8U5_9STRA|nr:hypothetical protein JKP88DRAFT_274243 [Tribonema minus]
MTDYIDDTTTLNGVLVAATLLATLGNACWDLDAEPPYHTAFSVMASIAFYSAIIAIWLSLFTLVMGNEKTPYVINYPRWTLASYLFFVLAIASGTVTFFLAGFVVTGSNAIMWPPFAVAVAVILLSHAEADDDTN